MGLLVFISYATVDSQKFQIATVAEQLQSYPEIDQVLYWIDGQFVYMGN